VIPTDKQGSLVGLSSVEETMSEGMAHLAASSGKGVDKPGQGLPE
jgi:hypothetical protein